MTVPSRNLESMDFICLNRFARYPPCRWIQAHTFFNDLGEVFQFPKIAKGRIAISKYLLDFFSDPINNLWMLMATVLVFAMHLGFATLEAGLTQAKNTVNVLFKNLCIIAIGLLIPVTFFMAMPQGLIMATLQAIAPDDEEEPFVLEGVDLDTGDDGVSGVGRLAVSF